MNDTHDFLLEKRLQNEAPDLHRRVTDSVSMLYTMLESFLSWFPDFTDHSLLHSLDVLDYSNQILGDQVWALNTLECYVLVMACYLHDVGMGISRKDFEVFEKELEPKGTLNESHSINEAQIIREQHNELSGLIIKKYSKLFDIFDKDTMFAIIQVARGHRKTDLLDELEYPNMQTENGVIRTPYLATVIRLADEIDVASNRNPELLFDLSNLTNQKDIDAFGTHQSIRSVEVRSDHIELIVSPTEPRFVPLVENLAEKIRQTLTYCRDVAQKRSDLCIYQEDVRITTL
ncbi:HD domain-containing protein [Butyrivibrio sp.]|jgi:hypothetical protein|uniref:HD domain-containing protein n=1 Tax=Butyrivibrio sp. TaxID=28121 RepID=UPI0025B8F7F8|nr:HD domain-containing protein [Butyrivibrio sp.]MBE5838522.1 hypothetical protein [Butyrivibrio sp.]